MIDIWMLFTMTVPFLEVTLHTCTEVMRRRGLPQFLPDGRVDQVKAVDHLLQPQLLPAWVAVVGRLLLPTISSVFIAVFWMVGLTVSYWPNNPQDTNMTDCSIIDLY